MVFKTKRIKPNATIGQRLGRARKQKEISLEQAQTDTLIRAKYLQAIEQDNWLEIPGRVYVQGYLRRYGDYLGFDGDRLVKQFGTDFARWDADAKNAPTTLKAPKTKISITPTLIALTLITLAVLIMVGYIGYQVHQISSPPTLVIVAPGEEVVWDQNQLEIVGRTSPGAVVLINNQNVVQDSQGNFRQQVNLESGLNTIEIVAKSRFNRSSSKIIKVLRPLQGQEEDHV